MTFRTAAWILALLPMVAISDASGETKLSSDGLSVGINEHGVLLTVPAEGVVQPDGIPITITPGFAEWYSVSYVTDDGQARRGFAPGGQTRWETLEMIESRLVRHERGRAAVTGRLGDLEIRSDYRFVGDRLHVTATLANIGETPLREVFYLREWRVPGLRGFTDPDDMVGLPDVPDDIVRRAWMWMQIPVGATTSVSFSYHPPVPIGGPRSGGGFDVPLVHWTSVRFPSGVPLGGANGISWGDLDSDGWLDLVLFQSGNVWRNVEGESWELMLDLVTDGVIPAASRRYGVAFADYNEDGLLDFAGTPRNNGQDECYRVLRNLGDWNFTDDSADGQIFDEIICNADGETIAWGDADGDLDLDVFLPAYQPVGNAFFRNLGPVGAGGVYQFMEESAEAGLDIPPGVNRPEGAQFVDSDFDGDLDLYCNGTLYQNVSTFGIPRFNPMTETGSGIGLSNELDEGAALFDYDMDGDYDLAIIYTGPGTKIWDNRGDGTFMPAGDIMENPLPGNNVGLGFEDWDMDGDLDFSALRIFHRNMLMEDGERYFSDATYDIPASWMTYPTPAYADWDHDGDLDCAMGNFRFEAHFMENTTYGPATPHAVKRHLRVRPLGDSETVPAGLENEFGATVEIDVLNVEETWRRKKYTAAAHGYNNQNEYTLHFALPEDPTPADPDEDVRFDVIVDFPTLPFQGIWRVDKHVNPALGNLDLADMAMDREIHVFRSGLVRMDGTDFPPTGESPVLTTAGGGLVSPQPDTAMPAPQQAQANEFVGIDLDTTGAAAPVRLREYILDGLVGASIDCGSPGTIRLWDVTDFGAPLLVDDATLDLVTSRRNRRTHVTADVVLQPDRRYRLVARVFAWRATDFAGPAAHEGLTVNGGLRFVDTDPCSGEGVASAVIHEDSLFMTVRFASALLGECPADLDDDGVVGFTDLLALLAAWGPCPGCAEDIDGDGDVGFVDLLTVLDDWGPCR
ncbi:MAG: VCBS repeat-containing protein [Phycisphaerae bacterium]|nr:VCBS repeat-containing protein [Phycisphaerae bacterium]